MECWFDGKLHPDLPVMHYQETCVTVTWIKLSQQILRLPVNQNMPMPLNWLTIMHCWEP